MTISRTKWVFNKIERVLQTSFFKTLYVNIKYFGIKGIVPKIYISRNIILRSVEGKVIIKKANAPIHIGYRIISLMDFHNEKGIFENHGTIIFDGDAHIGAGTKLMNYGTITFGNNFTFAGESRIVCKKNINFGDECLISWNCELMDTDWHPIFSMEDNHCINESQGIQIGNKVWIGSGATILKGSNVANDSVIASHSCISKDMSCHDHCILGSNNKILKESVYWER